MSALRVYVTNPKTRLPAAATLLFALVPVAFNIVSSADMGSSIAQWLILPNTVHLQPDHLFGGRDFAGYDGVYLGAQVLGDDCEKVNVGSIYNILSCSEPSPRGNFTVSFRLRS